SYVRGKEPGVRPDPDVRARRALPGQRGRVDRARPGAAPHLPGLSRHRDPLHRDRPGMSSRVRGEDGQAAIVLLMALVVILAVAGLVIDGAAVVTGKIGLQAEADAAARRGSEAGDAAAVEATGAGILDPAAAEDAAGSY